MLSRKKIGRFKEAKEEKQYWVSRLSSGWGGAYLLPDYERPAGYSPHDAQIDLSFPPESLAKLNKLTNDSPFLTYTVLLTTLKICLHKYSGSTVVSVGSPARKSGTGSQEEGAVVIVTEIDSRTTVQQLLTNVRQNLLDAYARQSYPFEQLLEALELDALGERCPLFDVAMVMDGFHLPLSQVKNDLTIRFAQDEAELSGKLEYSSRLFNAESIDRLCRRFNDVLSQLLEDVSRPVAEIDLLAHDERRKLVVEWNGAAVAYAKDRCIHHLFESQANRTPNAIALTSEEGSLTYRELDQRSNQVAHYLRSLGAGPEVVVGVSMARSLETIISILGILKAGAAYLPIDPSHPADRIAYMTELAQPKVVLTAATDWALIARESNERPNIPVSPANLAYVIFTSGSMGRPKGVAVPHGGLCNCFFTQFDYFNLETSDRIIQFASVNFDASVFEIVMGLCSGATLFMPRQHSVMVGSALADLLREQEITIATLPPSVVMSMPVQPLPRLRTMILAGEACRAEIVERWAAGRELFNLYGPTETTIWATGTKCETGGGKPSIGRAINNTNIYILNKQGQLCAVGVAGEIYIGGAGVARGYLNQFELTAERFVPDEFSGIAGARLYRTGDLARYNSNGEIEFLGRADEQVKLRGFRIEPGEIETVLLQQPGIEAALVIVSGDSSEEEQLVAYVVVAGGMTPDASLLRARLKEKLPDYMVPAFFISIPKIPLTMNGKLDKRSLPRVTRAIAREEQNDEELTAVEEMLANIWAGVLSVQNVRLDDNFLELGGHSLLATQVMTRVNEAFGVDLSLREIFEAPTLRELAQRIDDESKTDRSVPAKPLSRIPDGNKLSLSFAQERLLFLHQMEQGNSLYNTPIARRFRGPLNVAALAQSFSEVVRRHEVLRTSFPIVDGQPVQAIAEVKPVELVVTDLSSLPAEERDAAAQSHAGAEMRTPFDLEHGPVFRIKLLKLAEDDHLLLLTLHHIVSDAWSLGILFRELSTLYNSFAENQTSTLAELPVQYADYAAWQRDYLQGEVLAEQVNYWKQQLQGAPVLLELPTDRPRPAVQSYRGASESFRLPGAVSEKLKELSRREGVTLFMMLLAAFQVLLARYTGQQEIVVGTPIAGRTRKETERLIGLFMNTLALRTRIESRQSFREVVGQVRETCLGAYAHQEIPFERLVEELRPERSLSHTPLFQVFFQFFRIGRESVGFNDLTQQPFRGKTEKTKFDLTLAMLEDAHGVAGVLEYNTDLFDPATAARMVSHLVNLLTAAGTSPDEPVAFMQMLAAEERRQLLSEWNDTAKENQSIPNVVQLFEQQCERTPDAPAVVYKEETLTYAELNTRANRLACYLQSLGVGPDSLVAISIPRSTEMIVSLLAILKAGGAYLPLDPDYPAERLRYMMIDSGARWLLTGSETALDVPGVTVVRPASLSLQNESGENLRAAVTAQNLAYVIYTSGSTGMPKGVMIAHSSLINFLRSMLCEPGLREGDTLVSVTTLSFDIAALELFLPLVAGGRVVVVDRTVSTDAMALANVIENAPADIMQATPSTWRMLLTAGWKGSPRLKALCGGEALSDDLALSLSASVFELWNMYGPTETTIWSTVARIERDAPVTIGRGIENTKIYLLDKLLQPVPVGVLGEIYIGGDGVARGYLGQPGLTAERFVPDAFSDAAGARLYRTGDMAKWSAGGQLQYLGRTDNQIKLRGHRIELNEIESVLKSHENVKEAAVALVGSGGDARLVAYAVPHSDVTIDSAELRRFIRERLPDYMLPAGVVKLESLPLTANGKLDRRALSSRKAEYVLTPGITIAPRNTIEERLVELWRELLQVETVSVDSNFFDLGGHSLLLGRLSRELQEIYPVTIELVDLFKFATIEQLAGFISEQLSGAEPEQPLASIDAVETTNFADDAIAIIGLSGRFPGAADVQQYWENLRDGRETISQFSDEELQAAGVSPALLADPNYVKAHGILDDIDMFDASFFGFSPKEAEIMDPQQRLFMECAWQALESAGYDAERYPGRIGVYAGQSMSTYMLRLLRNSALVRSAGEFPIMIGNREDFLASRTCYKLNLRGPGVVVQSACSTSLVAVATACHSLLDGQTDIALAGGVSINLLDKGGYYYQPEGILSPDGHCRAFDRRAQGSVGGNGVGVVVLKKLSAALRDRDVIHAVIRGAAINNDGLMKIGYTAPSATGQAEVIALAQSRAGIDPETISYIETHGTGTVLGDPIEISALTQVFRSGTSKKQFCAIGSVKTNIGHLDAASGVAGLIKTVLALRHKQLPPSLHFETPNPQIDFENSPFYVNHKLSEWSRANSTPRRAAVSSFGIGGTNAHVVLEEEPAVIETGESRPQQLLALSARSQPALERATYNLSRHLRTHTDVSLADVAHTLQVGRKVFSHRRVVACSDIEDAIAALDRHAPGRVFTAEAASGQPPVAFMFSGQGTQYVGMGRQLYETERVFREQMDRCAELIEPQLGFDLRELLYGTIDTQDAARQLKQTSIAQPALFAVEYALAQLWISWGVRPSALIGHSIGEYVAACLAGVFSLEDALRLVTRRGRLMQQMPAGTMLVVPLPESEVVPMLNSRLSLASINGPSLCVVAGSATDTNKFEAQLAEQAVTTIRLHTSHAFHSWMMAGALEPFRAALDEVKLSAPRLPFVSNVTGTWITADEAVDPGYWVKQLRMTVRLSEGLEQLFKEKNMVLVEAGPGRTLTNSAGMHPAKPEEQLVVSSLPHAKENETDLAVMLTSLGRVWLSGVTIDWNGFYADEQRRRVELPSYPFERESYWIDAPNRPPRPKREEPVASLIPAEPSTNKFHKRPRLSTEYAEPTNDLERAIADLWQELLGIQDIGIYDNFFELGGHSLLGTMLLTRLRKQFQVELALATLFEAPTVADLALTIEERLIREIGELAADEIPQPV